MKRFQFALETLLQHRRNVEEKERTKFSRIRGELLLENDHQQDLHRRRSQAESELATRAAGPFEPQEVVWYGRYLDRLKLQIERSAERIAVLEKGLEAQKQIMIGATRDRKIIENLRKRKQSEYQTALAREEQKVIDDMVVTRFAGSR